MGMDVVIGRLRFYERGFRYSGKELEKYCLNFLYIIILVWGKYGY